MGQNAKIRGLSEIDKSLWVRRTQKVGPFIGYIGSPRYVHGITFFNRGKGTGRTYIFSLIAKVPSVPEPACDWRCYFCTFCINMWSK